MKKWHNDYGLAARMMLTMFLLAAVYLFFLAVLSAYGGVGTYSLIVFAGFFLLIQFFLSDRLVLWSMGGRDRRGAGAAMIVWVVSLVVWILSFLLIRTLSRYREFAADRGSAIITGHPSHLASALMSISGVMERVPSRDLREVKGMNAFFIIPAISGDSIMNLFSTHPTVEARIRALEEMERRMEF